jgi:GrpB-like predicted nucleotidyltransferase (UPF0157 family)
VASSTHRPRPLVDEHVEITAYYPAWHAQAEEEIERLRVILGTREILHIGSTAVPGLAAKPIIDLQLAIAKPASAKALTPILSAAGYEDLGEAGLPGRRYFRRREPPFPVNLHAVWDRKLWQQNIAVRNYLRDNPHEADFYARQKREILAQGGSSLNVYSEAKAPFLKELIAKSRCWAEGVTAWERHGNRTASPPSDSAQPCTHRVKNDTANEARSTDAFYAALTAAIRLGEEARFDVDELEALRREVALAIVADHGTSTVMQVRSYEEPLRTAGLIYLLDEYCDEQGEALEPRARRKLKFEVESWQTELRRLERAGHNVFSLAGDLDGVKTKEELAAWFRRQGIGKDWPLGR